MLRSYVTDDLAIYLTLAWHVACGRPDLRGASCAYRSTTRLKAIEMRGLSPK